jgi:fatty-acyl-CoA synthase
MLEHGATVTAAVPTVWLLLLDFLEKENLTLSTLKRVVIGGSACPRAVIEKFQNKYGIKVLHAWGMTEMSPLGTICSFKPEVVSLSEEEKLNVQETTGHPPFSVDLKITNDQGTELPWDGVTPGKLWARGAAVVKRYLKSASDIVDQNGWFDTGDVATIDPNGYMRITDRSKDVIKSGGEWISSIDLENAAVGHPAVSEAAAIGVAHPKWDERPIVVVVCHGGERPDKSKILDVISKNVAKWQVPDDVIYMDEIPHTATGKISKLELRQQISDMNYVHPDLKQ